MPYFNQLYGEKYTGMLMLARMHLLLNKSVVNVVDKISIVFLAYNITSSGFRQIPLMAKLSVVTGLAENKIELPSFDWSVNTNPINLPWILGFMMGDGGIYVRIRDVGTGVQFIPMFRIGQKNTLLNQSLLNSIKACLTSLGISSLVKASESRMMEIQISGKNALDALMTLLEPYSHFFYWKGPQFGVLTRILFLQGINIRNWVQRDLALLDLVYLMNPENRVVPYSQMADRIRDIHSERAAGAEPFVSLSKGTSWVVTLPKSLKISPTQKYFAFSTNGGRDGAFEAAKAYRDQVLNQWLEDHTKP